MLKVVDESMKVNGASAADSLRAIATQIESGRIPADSVAVLYNNGFDEGCDFGYRSFNLTQAEFLLLLEQCRHMFVSSRVVSNEG